MLAVAVIIIAVVALLAIVASVRILKQYERGVQFRLGKVKDGARGPGLIFIAPLVDRVHRVSLRIVTMPIQSQGIITKDNVSVDVSAVAYFRIKDAVRSVVAIENVDEAISQIAQTTLRASSAATRWTRPCPRRRASTATSAPSSMSRPRSGASR
jgi:regulator of protease activity HflC (stomatin/prohibitin superfamily)